MYVDTATYKKDGKSYKRYLLRESYRNEGKVCKRTILNITFLGEETIKIIKMALQCKKANTEIITTKDIEMRQGYSVGVTTVIQEVAKRLGIMDALGNDENGKLALWQVMARVIEQGSRLSAARLGKEFGADKFLGIKPFNEDKLYSNLKYLSSKQKEIENFLFKSRYKDKNPSLYLYDVTSSYLEGQENAFGAFGYNRDKKKGKKQIVVGLLCDQDGYPLSVEVFPGNTQDTSTMASQIKKVAERFGGGDVTLVGDRGMIKSKQIQDLYEHKFHYISAITKPQIESLLKEEIIEIGLFDSELAEIIVIRENWPAFQNYFESKEFVDECFSEIKEPVP